MDDTDGSMAAQFERIIRRVKQSMRYRGSYSTRDILGSLVARWVSSGEWARLRGLPPKERHIGQSVRRFILDRIGQLRRRGDQVDVAEDEVTLPDEASLVELIEEVELRGWIDARIGELEEGRTDVRFRMPLASVRDVGRALRLHVAGMTQRQIASELGVSLGVANKRIADGTNYLIVLQAIETGVGGSA